ncbi:MAG: hypothetical protein WDW38_009849 [Sanguina aurantia]
MTGVDIQRSPQIVTGVSGYSSSGGINTYLFPRQTISAPNAFFNATLYCGQPVSQGLKNLSKLLGIPVWEIVVIAVCGFIGLCIFMFTCLSCWGSGRCPYPIQDCLDFCATDSTNGRSHQETPQEYIARKEVENAPHLSHEEECLQACQRLTTWQLGKTREKLAALGQTACNAAPSAEPGPAAPAPEPGSAAAGVDSPLRDPRQEPALLDLHPDQPSSTPPQQQEMGGVGAVGGAVDAGRWAQPEPTAEEQQRQLEIAGLRMEEQQHLAKLEDLDVKIQLIHLHEKQAALRQQIVAADHNLPAPEDPTAGCHPEGQGDKADGTSVREEPQLSVAPPPVSMEAPRLPEHTGQGEAATLEAAAWKKGAQHWCDVCKCWMNNTNAAKQHHERGMGHQENLAKKLREMGRKNDREKLEAKQAVTAMTHIEAAANRQYAKDQKAEAALVGKWLWDVGAGYYYNAVHRWYYDPKTRWYYGGEPVDWAEKPASLPAIAMFGVAPSEGGPPAAAAAITTAAAAGGSSAPPSSASAAAAAASSAAAAAANGSSSAPFSAPTKRVVIVSQHPLANREDQVTAATAAATAAKAAAAAKARPVSAAEAEMIAKREAARARVTARTMSQFGYS